MKYNVLLLDILTVYTDRTPNVDLPTNKQYVKQIVQALCDGYEIISAIPCGNSEVAKIQYILRKEI